MNDKTKKKTPAEKEAEREAENKAIEDLEENMLEMRSAMYSMMSSSAKTMQAFINMRMNYLKMMQVGLEDPVTTMNIISKNLADTVQALRDERRKEDEKAGAKKS